MPDTFVPFVATYGSRRVYLAKKRYSRDASDVHLDVVLCYLPDNPSTPFATWARNVTDPAPGTFWGHYSADLQEAICDFSSRGTPRGELLGLPEADSLAAVLEKLRETAEKLLGEKLDHLECWRLTEDE